MYSKTTIQHILSNGLFHGVEHLRTLCLLLLMVVIGGGNVWGQDYSGTYYIKSGSANKNTDGDYYLCPTKNWYLYKDKNSYENDTDDDDDNGKPFLTTYQCKNGVYDAKKAVWTIVKHPTEENCYYIKQSKTDRYMVSNGKIGSDANRMRVHLESVADADALSALGDLALFEITPHDDHVDIVPHSSEGRNTDTYKYLVVNFKNFNELKGSAGKAGGPSGTYGTNTAGIIGLYNQEENHKWILEETPARPEITNNFDGTFTITAEAGATIYYTIDGTEPTTSSSIYSTPITQTEGMTVIKAIAKAENDFSSSKVATYNLTRCEKPVITVSGNTVTITCATEGAVIHYTTDGTTVTSSSPTYEGPFAKGDISTIRAIATKTGYANSSEATLLPPTEVSSSDEMTDMGGNYILASNFSSNASIGTSENPFSGTIDGNMVTVSGLSHPLVAYANGATIKNVMLKNVHINQSGNVGAITGEAKGYTRIYNCGILPNDNTFSNRVRHSSVTSTDGYCGGLVGLLDDDSRVINCFSYANVNGGTTVGGIVGYNNFASTTKVTDGKYTELKTVVVNCMFYGNITGGTTRYPVYGGMKILNNTATGINNYDFYRAEANLGLADNSHYNCSWPAKEEFLTKYEFYRYLLNSNRELCGWWVGAPSAPSGMPIADVQAVAKDASLMAKWVLDPSIAPYPILKAPGKYYSAINQNPDNRINPVSKAWESRPTSSNTITTKAAPDTEGQKLGSITVTINKGGSLSGSSSKNIPITAMDIANNDFCYGKIQLPYYNSIFGDPNSNDWTTRYGGNYGDQVVVGWEISAIEGGVAGITDNEDKGHKFTEDWQDGYNFADRYCTTKDENRTFAQGGYYYVPNGVTAITITAKWADAVYLDNSADHSYDRVYMSYNTNPNKYIGYHFAPAGSRPSSLGNDKTVQTASVSSKIPDGSVYENAIVLVGNHQYRTDGNDVGTADKGCTIISADFDFDDEPDYSLIWQLGTKTNRQNICPIRFDFLPVIEMGMAMKEDASTQYYSLGCYLPLGHFEVTETSLIHFGQFEFGNAARTKDAPLILNGGIFDQYCKGTKAKTNADDHIDYVILGGNVYMPSFSPGAHVNAGAKYPTRHCAVNVLGGRINNLYLTGNFNNAVTPNKDNPHCYIDGGNFKQIAAAAKEGINGDVYFKINHSIINEFYGGSTLADKLVTGSIDVTVDNSKITKYCGGPKFGNMASGKTVTTNATGTTFGVYYGGGNGGTSYVQYASTDKTVEDATGSYDWDSSSWGNLTSYTPNTYRSGGKNYIADYEMEIVNSSAGTDAKKGIFRTYFYAAQFSATNTGPITNNLTDCKVLTNFYGGGNLGGVIGDVTSTLTDTKVLGSAFGAGYSASVPEVTIYNKDKTAPTLNVYTGIITPTPDPDPNSTSTTYTWCYKNKTTNVVIPSGVVIPDGVSTGNPTFEYEEKKYFYTEESLENLGTVSGKATLNINGTTTVGKSVYGGGEESGVAGDTEVNVTRGTIGSQGQGGVEYGNVYGGGKGKVGDKVAGYVKGNTTVNISQASAEKPTIIYHNVYGGGAYGSVGDFTYDSTTGMPTACAENTGSCTVNIQSGTFGWNGKENGMVFGSSRGDVATPEGTPAVDPNDRMAWVYSTQVNIGTENATTGPTIKGSIYGSGENGHTLQNTVLNINSGTVGIPTGEKITDDNGTPDNKDDDIEYSGANYPYRGNVYGGGCGTDTYNDGTVDKYNPLAGIVKGTTTIYIKGGHVVRNVYGAGAMGSVGGGTTTDAGKTTINVTGGRIGYDGNSNNDGCIFGAARGENGISTATSNLANVRETEVNINAHPTDATKSPVIWGSVFGGGEAGTVKEGVAVNMTGGLIHKDIYGGGALADTQTSNWDATGGTWADAQKSALHTTTVRATGGRVVEEIFGGGLGEDGKPAYVWGDVLLDLNGTTPIDETTHKPSTTGMATTSTTGCVVGQIFGCNNVNGTPKGDVMVHIYATQNAEADKIANTPATGTEGEEGYKPADETQKVKGRYDITAVYGGGNMAAYEPADPDNNKSEVIIDGCQLTSIKTVYGGGNAACTPSTNVTVNGTFEVEELFGGGNGLDDIDVNGVTKPNPGANVGYKNYSEYYQEGGVWKVRDKAGADTKEERLVSSYVYGTGKASVNIFGGTVHRVFGGSNTKGNVRQTAVTLLDENSGCDFCVDEAYGGGKSAPMDAEAKLLMSCIPGLKAAYGGAEAANIEGDVTLNITNGNFDRVFGGNNKSGRIGGTITVNIEETGCKPVIIGQLYGGGNQAPYTAPEGEHGPTLNIKSFTSIGEVYGGGYGEGAVVTGDTYVNINEVVGDKSSQDEFMKETVADVTDPATQTTGTDKVSKNTGVTKTFKDGDGDDANTISVDIPLHKKGDIGSIGVVFGGGNAAQVVGNTHVNIGTLSSVDYVTKASGESVARTGITPVGADIRGNVYGGGNNAEVTGNTNVVIGEKYTSAP